MLGTSLVQVHVRVKVQVKVRVKVKVKVQVNVGYKLGTVHVRVRVQVKVKVQVRTGKGTRYHSDIYICMFSRLITFPHSSAIRAQPHVLIQHVIRAPGTHHCCFTRCDVNSHFPQCFTIYIYIYIYDWCCWYRTPDPVISGPMP